MKHEISIAFQTDKRASEYVALAKLVNQYDFDVVSVYCDAPFHPSYAPLLLMAPHINKARIGPAAVAPSRIHPIDIASQTALLADIVHDRVYIGLARGGWLEDHGIHESARPIQAIRESIEVIQYLLSGGNGGYSGEIYQIADYVQSTYPIPDKPIPILIGTWGEKLGTLAGEIANEVKIGGSANPEMIPVMQAYIAQGTSKAIRQTSDVGIVIGAVSVIDEDRQQARMAARKALTLYLPIVAKLDPTVNLEPEFVDKLRRYVEQKELDNAVGMISDDLLDKFAFSGTPADIIRQSEHLFDAGANRIEFGTPHGLTNPQTGIHLLGTKVIPALQER